MPEVHFGIFVIEDSILDNLSDIKRDILNYNIIKQGPLGHHFTHIGHQDETRCDEVMPYLGNIDQMFGLKVHCMPFIVYFPFPLVVCEHPKNLGIVWGFVVPIICFGINWIKVIILVDKLRTKV